MTSGLKFEKIRTDQEIQAKLHPTLAQEIREYIFYFLRVLVCVALIFVTIKTQIYQATAIEGKSMFPTLDNGDIVFIDLFTPKFGDYRRGDIIVIKPPIGFELQNKYLIKRVVGLPGESVGLENGDVFIYNPDYPRGIKLDESGYLSKDVRTYKTSSSGKEKIIYDKLGKDQYFVLGDNRGGSTDSRVFEEVPKNRILGKEFYRSFPSKTAGTFRLPSYNINN
jgi:signal peptidase I